MKGKNKYLPVCAAMYANYAAHGFGLIILTQTAAWLMEKFNTDMVGVSYLVSVMAIGKRSEERRVGKECRSRWSPYH